VLSQPGPDATRTIVLNRPERLNAMNRQLVDDVAQAFDDANADPDTRVIVFTGAGRAFCAGDDRHEHVHPRSDSGARDLVDAIQRATDAIVFGPKPVVGAINGWAVGGGFEWAINCDFPIWAESACGFFPEVSLNLFVTGAVTSLLPALVGLTTAREMLFFGDRYPASRLLALGVAWRVVADDQLLTEAHAVAARLAGLPPLAVQAMKRVLNRTAMTDMRLALAHETDATVEGLLDPLTTRLLKDF
jgi:enoyl-CoA hydratase/carnithine racemase